MPREYSRYSPFIIVEKIRKHEPDSLTIDQPGVSGGGPSIDRTVSASLCRFRACPVNVIGCRCAEVKCTEPDQGIAHIDHFCRDVAALFPYPKREIAVDLVGIG